VSVDQTRLGSLRGSRLILGCGNSGGIGSAPAFHGMGETEAQAIDLMDRAWAAGINAFDTADAYGGGRSETYIGRWLKAKGSSVRDRLVLTSKVFNPVGPGPDERGVALSTLALAWVLAQPNVAAAVIGPRQPSHLQQALAVREVQLMPGESAQLARGF